MGHTSSFPSSGPASLQSPRTPEKPISAAHTPPAAQVKLKFQVRAEQGLGQKLIDPQRKGVLSKAESLSSGHMENKCTKTGLDLSLGLQAFLRCWMEPRQMRARYGLQDPEVRVCRVTEVLTSCTHISPHQSAPTLSQESGAVQAPHPPQS